MCVSIDSNTGWGSLLVIPPQQQIRTYGLTETDVARMLVVRISYLFRYVNPAAVAMGGFCLEISPSNVSGSPPYCNDGVGAAVTAQPCGDNPMDARANQYVLSFSFKTLLFMKSSNRTHGLIFSWKLFIAAVHHRMLHVDVLDISRFVVKRV